VSRRNFRTDAALRPQPERDPRDFWPTPPCLRAALIRCVLPLLPEGLVWECAAGEEELLATDIRNAGRAVIATDLHTTGHDFLTCEPPATDLAAIVTNPSFSLLNEFMERGRHLLESGAACAFTLLLRWDHFMADGRAQAIDRAAWIHRCVWRARWLADSTGQPRWIFAWITWLATDPGPPRLTSIRPDQPQRKREKRQHELSLWPARRHREEQAPGSGTTRAAPRLRRSADRSRA
jgi:hypothetical protein